MLTTKILYSLATIPSSESNCISIYANYSSLKNLQQIVKSYLRLTEINISSAIKKHILSTNITQGTIAIFYSGAKSIKFINLNESVENSYYKGNIFNLLPLYNYYSKRPRFSLVIINKNKAVIYDFKNEELSEIINIFRETIDMKENQGYYNLSVGASGGVSKKKSKFDALEYEYFLSISKDLIKFNKEKGLKYSVVLSSIKLESNIKELFNNPNYKLIFEQYNSKKSEHTIIEESLKLIDKEKSKLDKKYIQELIELNYPINKLAINIGDVFKALNERKVDTMFIKDKIKPKKGFVCSKCEYLSHDGDSPCAYCKSKMQYSSNIALNILNICIMNKTDIQIYQHEPKILKNKDVFALKVY